MNVFLEDRWTYTNINELLLHSDEDCKIIDEGLIILLPSITALTENRPDRLFSPHTVFLRKFGHSYEIANALCSLLIGLNYDAYVVSGYAVRDITLKIMTRINCPFPEEEEKEEEAPEQPLDPKYVLKPPLDLRSKFLLQMEQRERDKELAEKKRIEEEHRKEIEELEKPPFDELHGLRLHAWVLVRPGKRDITEPFFIEPSTGYKYELDSTQYCGIESIWNDTNYWVNLQDCSNGLDKIDLDLSNVANWEHLLVGEPIAWRKTKPNEDMDDDEIRIVEIHQEKHLDMPIPWSMAINIPHDVVQTRFPSGVRSTCYKRTLVEEFAPYVQDDGLVIRICRFNDLECSPDKLYIIEERYENRHDHMTKIVEEIKTGVIMEYFSRGREDAAKVHKYYALDNEAESPRTIEFYNKSRFDCMSKLELHNQWMTETYVDSEDFFAYRHVKYAKRGHPPPGILEGPRRIVLNLLEKFNKNPAKKASEDIATREFSIIDKEIHLKFHYEKGKVTASTRDFIKPPMAEMGDRLTFNPELTSGYQAEVGAKPPRQLNLFNLLEQQIKEEEESLRQVREIEDMVAEFVRLRDLERAVPKLDVSIFNREQNKEYTKGMMEREQQQKEHREREVEEETDFLSPYLVKLKNTVMITESVAHKLKADCLKDFSQLLVDRANDIQRQFETCTAEIQQKQQWYTQVLDTLTLLEEENYFKELNNAKFHLHTLEMRLVRHRDLSGARYEALANYLNSHPLLSVYEQGRP